MEIPSFGSAVARSIPGTFVPDIPLSPPHAEPLTGGAEGAAAANGPSFADTLKGLIGNVSDKVTESDQATRDLASGKTNDLSKVVTSVEEANLALQFTMAVRNKLLESYQEISRMQV